MNRALSEVQVLKKLNIEDFRHLTKDKVMTMVTMLDRMDPEVAKKALEQFPEFAGTMKHMLSEYKQLLESGLKENAEETKSFCESCDAIISSCQKLLNKEELTFDEKRYILDQMIVVAKIKGDKNTEDKRFINTMWCCGVVALGIAIGALVTTLGGNIKIDTDPLKKGK